ncbi:MAG: T9SS type A sorting domain-containing protein, partial [Bacteroidetes bacterium]|nr:T9SS type A sorting domain-containing protein [Bacteroidota bacterium]
HLTVLPAIVKNQTLTICSGQSLAVGTHTYTSSGNYTDVLTSYKNCDSTVTTHLTVLPAIVKNQTLTICSGQSLAVGTHTYTSSGNYTDVLTSVHSCDSIVITQLFVSQVDTSVSVSSNTLTANAVSATYQWINCNNGNAPVTNETNQSFTASANGNYAVIVNQNGCSDTSSCYNIIHIGIKENSSASFFNIYPNPFTFQTTVEFSQEQKNTNLKILDDLGKELKSINFSGKKIIIEKGELPPGIYLVQVKTELGIISKKIIINK